MPNGGHICCDYCTFSTFTPGKCDVHGVPTNPSTLCRTFRPPRESHEEAKKHWPLLNDLDPGVVYEINNYLPSPGGKSSAIYKMQPIRKA